MTTDDLATLADALTFAMLVTVCGLIAGALIRRMSRRPGLRLGVTVGLCSATLLTAALLGLASLPTAREGVGTVGEAVVVPGRPRTTPAPSGPPVAPEPAPGSPRSPDGPTSVDGHTGPSISGGGGVLEMLAAIRAPIPVLGRTPVPARTRPRHPRLRHLLLLHHRHRRHLRHRHPPRRRHLPRWIQRVRPTSHPDRPPANVTSATQHPRVELERRPSGGGRINHVTAWLIPHTSVGCSPETPIP